MKFKLINENTRGLSARPSQDLVNEELFTEATKYEDELAVHILADMANAKYRLSGYKASLSKNQKSALESALLNYCKNNLKLGGKAAHDKVDYIWNVWHVHHINGVHPTSRNNENNRAHNVAFISPDIHDYITNTNRDIVRQMCNSLPTLVSNNVDKMIFRLLMVCRAEKVNPSEVLKIGFKDFDNFMKSIPKALDENFRQLFKYSDDRVIYIEDLHVSGL